MWVLFGGAATLLARLAVHVHGSFKRLRSMSYVSRATNFIMVFSGRSMFLDPEGTGLKTGRREIQNFHEYRLVGALLVVANLLSVSETVCSVVEVMDTTEDDVLGLDVKNSSVITFAEAHRSRKRSIWSGFIIAARLSFPSCSFPSLRVGGGGH